MITLKKRDTDTPKCCEFCRFAGELSITGEMICEKKGIVPKDYSCRSFIYDALKRVPRKPPKLFVPDELTEDI